jgi:hypothetical protein
MYLLNNFNINKTVQLQLASSRARFLKQPGSVQHGAMTLAVHTEPTKKQRLSCCALTKIQIQITISIKKKLSLSGWSRQKMAIRCL